MITESTMIFHPVIGSERPFPISGRIPLNKIFRGKDIAGMKRKMEVVVLIEQRGRNQHLIKLKPLFMVFIASFYKRG